MDLEAVRDERVASTGDGRSVLSRFFFRLAPRIRAWLTFLDTDAEIRHDTECCCDVAVSVMIIIFVR